MHSICNAFLNKWGKIIMSMTDITKQRRNRISETTDLKHYQGLESGN